MTTKGDLLRFQASLRRDAARHAIAMADGIANNMPPDFCARPDVADQLRGFREDAAEHDAVAADLEEQADLADREDAS